MCKKNDVYRIDPKVVPNLLPNFCLLHICQKLWLIEFTAEFLNYCILKMAQDSVMLVSIKGKSAKACYGTVTSKLHIRHHIWFGLDKAL